MINITKLADLDRLYETIKTEKGHLGIVYANAGIGTFSSLEEVY